MKSLDGGPAPVFVVSRTLNAPRAQVFQAWTQTRYVERWFAPGLFSVPRCALDVRPGGALEIVMRSPEGTNYAMVGRFLEVVENERLVYTQELSQHPADWHAHLRTLMDQHGAHHPLVDTEVTVTFEDHDRLTRLTVSVAFASEGMRAAFLEMGMRPGWEMCLDKLEDVLTERRELRISRLVDAPQALVFAAFTDPRHVAEWWGPDGFTHTVHEMNVTAGGIWRYTMHGPNGVDYPNLVQYHEVEAPKRLVYGHGDGSGPAMFHTTITFQAEGEQTRVTLRAVFDSAEACEKTRESGATEGGKQNLARFAAHLESRLRVTLPSDVEFVLTRAFHAPLAAVYAAWVEPEHLARWWGRASSQMITCEVDLRVGGQWRYQMREADGSEHAFRGTYHVVEAAVLEHTFIYEPMPDFVAHVTVTFAEHDGWTTVTEATRHASQAARDGHLEGVEEGAQSLERLEALLTAQVEGEHAFVYSRVFDAPRAQVWAAFTQAEHLAHWWGPVGFALKIDELDLRPGGIFRYTMVADGGFTMHAKWYFRAVELHQSLAFVLSFCDAEGKAVRAPHDETWPLRMVQAFRFEDAEGGRTRLSLELSVLGEGASQREAFLAERSGMAEGFGGTFDQLDAYLAL